MRRLLLATLVLGCTPAARVPPDNGTDAGFEAGADAETDADAGTDAGAGDAEPPDAEACALGRSCNPILIDAFPFVDRRDTRSSPSDEIDTYDCAPETDESGPEVFYQLHAPVAGLLSASVDDMPGDGTDVDVHLLTPAQPWSCVARDNVGFARLVEPGDYFIVADTWVDGSGSALAGPYELNVSFTETASGSCAMAARDVRMFWSECAPSVPSCFEGPGPNGSPARFLATPAVGEVVKEAHLVTTGEDFGGAWPTSATDQIQRHYSISEAATGWAFARSEPWAPAGEGGSQWGQGATGAPVPVEDESWYINMYWRDRPAPGTRMIVVNPANGRAVVASAGYETGPGSNTAIAGVAEEIHLYLGTIHRDELQIGFAADQTLRLGPIQCR